MPELDDKMRAFIDLMASVLCRLPTEDEAYSFIMGDDATRRNILNA